MQQTSFSCLSLSFFFVIKANIEHQLKLPLGQKTWICWSSNLWPLSDFKSFSHYLNLKPQTLTFFCTNYQFRKWRKISDVHVFVLLMFLTPSISFASKQKDVDLSVICEKEVSQYFSPVKMMVCRHANSWFFLVILSL